MVLVGLVILIIGVFSLVRNRNHILVLLLSLEFIILGVFLVLLSYLVAGATELIVFYLVVVVCEASLGLGVLIMIVYFFGSDLLGSLSLLRC